MHHTSQWARLPDASSDRQDAWLILMPHLALTPAALVSTLQLATGVFADSGVHRSTTLGEEASGPSGAAVWPEGPAGAPAAESWFLLRLLGLSSTTRGSCSTLLCLPLLSAAASHRPRLPGLLRAGLPHSAAALGIPDMRLWASVSPLLLLLPPLPWVQAAGAALLGAGKSQGDSCRRPYPSLLHAVPALPTLENSCSREKSCPQESEGGRSLGPACSKLLDASCCSRAHGSSHDPAMHPHLYVPVLGAHNASQSHCSNWQQPKPSLTS